MLHASCIQWPSYIVLSLSRRSVTIKNNHLFSVTGGIFSKKDSSLRTEILTSLWFMSNQSGLSFKWTHCSLEDHLTLTFSKLLLKHKINKKASTKNKRQHLSCGLSFDSLNDYTKRPFFFKICSDSKWQQLLCKFSRFSHHLVSLSWYSGLDLVFLSPQRLCCLLGIYTQTWFYNSSWSDIKEKEKKTQVSTLGPVCAENTLLKLH